MLHTVFARVIGEFLFVDLFGIEAGCHPGVATYLDDDRKEVLMDIATYLQRNYSNLGRGIAYLERLAGRTAFVRERPPTLQGLLMLVNRVGVLRGAVVFGNPAPHTLHRMRVTFHR